MENIFDLGEFSPNIIVEWASQHLDTYPNKFHMNNHQMDDDSRKWIKLADVLQNCLKHDLKDCKWSDGKQNGLKNRDTAREVFSNWSQDISVLCVKLNGIVVGSSDEHVSKEVTVLSAYFAALHKLCILLQCKDKPNLKKDEVVFFFEDES